MWDGQLRIIAELASNNALVKKYVYAEGVNSPEYMIHEGKKYLFVKDHRGSVNLVVNAETGEIKQKLRYSEWGEVLEDTSPGFQPFGFAGGLYDGVTKLYRFGARDYDPELGRWLSKDPIRFEGGDTNLYGYVLQDPINQIDVNGKVAVEVGVAVVVVAVVVYKCYQAHKKSIDRKIKPINDEKGTPTYNSDGTKRDEFERIYDGNAAEDIAN